MPLSLLTAVLTSAEISYALLTTCLSLSTSLLSPLFSPNGVSTTTYLSLDTVSPPAYPPLLTLSSCYFPFLSNGVLAVTSPLLSTGSPAQYFCKEIGPKATSNQIKNLFRATQGFVESQRLDPNTFPKLFTKSTGSFDGSVPISTWRLRRLCQILNEIDHHFVQLLGHIYFAHKVGQIPISKKRRRSEG